MNHRHLAVAPLLAAAFAAHADVHKCQGPNGVTYTEAPCPSHSNQITYSPPALGKAGASPSPGQDPAPPRVAAAPAPAPVKGGRVVDGPLPAWDSNVAIIEQVPGRSAWLDADTFAVTTFTEPRAKIAWMFRRIVALDTRSRSVATIVPKGFLDCANAELGLVSLEQGDLDSKYGVRSTSPAPVQRFQSWDAASRSLRAAGPEFAAGWHAQACLKTAPEDVSANDWWEGTRSLRYLQPKDGVVAWGMGDNGRPEGPSLRNGNRKVLLKDVSTSDVTRLRYLPWRKSYQLTAGHLTVGTGTETPLVVMGADGQVTKSSLPPALRAAIEGANPAGIATSWAVKPGLLVAVPGAAAQGGGLYLAAGGDARRVWCVPGGGPEAAACRIVQDPDVSPDGCKVAFDARTVPILGEPTIHVIDVCAATAPATTAKGH